LTEDELMKFGMALTNSDHLLFRCEECGREWTPNQLRGGRLPSGWWRCPSGCNEPKEWGMGEAMTTLGEVLREARDRRGWSAQRVALELDFLDLRSVRVERVEAYEADRIEPTGSTVAAMKALLRVRLEEVDGLLSWPAEGLAAKLFWYVGRVAKAQAMGRGRLEETPEPQRL
jgi:transcriptional regulator with XRE-family HTH domain